MQKLTTLLEKGNLTPKERVMLLVHDYVAKDTTDKEILTKADKHALCEGWKPKNNGEVDEYNRYNDGWRTEGLMKLDAQTTYLNMQNALLRASRVVDYAMWTDCKNEGGYFRKVDLNINQDEALDLIIKNSGLVFNQVVHQLAFKNLSEKVKQDILALCPDAETERQYLDNEETLADLFNGKKQLKMEDKEILADLIIGVLHNKYAKILEKKGLKREEWWFSGYFAELPTIEIAKKWADYSNVSYDVTDKEQGNELSKKIENYAEEHKIDTRELLKKTILRWLDEGLFVEEYQPIWNSNTKSTCNDTNTKLPHKEILKRWLKAKVEAKAMLQELIDSGWLKVESRDQDFYGVKETVKILTGKSLYNLEGDFSFTEDYKKQVNNLSSLGSLIIFLRNRDFLEDYASLLAIAEIYKKLSKIYEIDMGYKVNAFINEFGKSIYNLNSELNYVADKLEESIHRVHDINFPAEVFLNDMLIHLKEIEPVMGEAETHYLDEFKKISFE
jgi:hypothetical protein